jgi:hypothetical protein
MEPSDSRYATSFSHSGLFGAHELNLCYDFRFLGVLALCSEFFNDLGGKNYERFARTNYFDRNGVFITTMFSTPMLLHMFLAVVGLERGCRVVLWPPS